MRHRVEDLGRLAILLDHIVNQEVLDNLFGLYNGRNKDFVEWFQSQSKEKQEHFLHQLPYALETIKEKLYECIVIAEGLDDLNNLYDSKQD